jgi:DnaJ homolog subfamily A member 2
MQIIDQKKICKACKGKKISETTKKIEVAIEQGTPTDHIVKFSCEGNEIPGAEAGDLLVKIGVKKHKTFTRNGADLFVDKELTLKQALLGFNFQLKFLDGKDITISSITGECFPHGAVKSVKGKGLPFYRDTMNFGNLIIKFTVKFPGPSDLSEDMRNALSKVSDV